MKSKHHAPTLLIVDDEEAILEALRYYFELSDFTVLTANSGNQAIRLLSTQPVHAVLTDIRMPDGNGVELLKHIRNQDPHLPVILMTGFTDISEPEMLKLGANRIFWKPFDLKELSDFISKLLESNETSVSNDGSSNPNLLL